MAGPVLAATPIAVDDGPVVVQKDAAAAAIDVLANDTAALDATVTAATDPAHGTVVIAQGGRSLTYQPDASYTGPDTFTYTVTDTDTSTDTATVTMRVNAPPVAVDDPAEPTCIDPNPLLDFGGAFPIPEDYGTLSMPPTCSATVNDLDPDGTIASWLVDDLPVHGTLAWSGGQPGAFSYAPHADFNTIAGNLQGGQWESDSFTYHVVDDRGGVSNEATYRFWIAPINDAPTFVSAPTSVSVARNSGPYDASWQAFASAGPADESDQHVDFVITGIVAPCVSCLFAVEPTFTAGGHLIFTPRVGQTGVATVTVHLHDDGGLDDLGVPNLAVPPANTSNPTTFTIKVNDPPVAVDNPSTPACTSTVGGTFALPEDKVSPFIAGGSCNLLANDTDSDGTVLDWEIVTQPAHGTVTNDLPLVLPGLSSDFSYTPDANYFTAPGDWVSDSFTYRAIDDDGGRSAPATVRFWIAPVNDAPTFDAGPLTVTSGKGQAYSQPWATNTDPGPNEGAQAVTYHVATSPANDGTLFSAPPAISATGVLAFTGAAGKTGTATFTVTAQDDGGRENYGAQSDQPPAADTSDPVTLTITIANEPPVAVDDPAIPTCMSNAFGGSFPIAEDWGQFVFGASCSPIANDTDADGTIVSWQVDTPPAHGTLDWIDSGIPGFFGYTSDPDYSTPAGDWLSDSLSYHVIDDEGASSNIATYRFWIAPVNDAPTFSPGTAIVHGLRGTAYDQAWATAISPGPYEPSQTVHFEITATNLHGNPNLFAVGPSIAADGHLTFTLATGQTGSATITLVAKDDGGLESYSGVTIHPKDTSDPVTFDIVADNSPPVAGDDSLTVTEDQTSAGDVAAPLANDTDVDPDALTITAKTNGLKGVATITGGGTGVSYTPNASAFGIDSFTYTVSDGHGGTDIGSVNVTITAANDAPDAVDDTPAAIGEDSGANPIDALGNDTDPDLDTLTITARTDGAKGTVAIAGGGTGLTYTPATNANGADSFTYTVDDGHGGTDTATVTVTITAVNDAPVAGDDSLTVTEDQVAAGAVAAPLANDTDVDGDTMTITGATNGAKGSVTITGGGTGISYKPNANAFGSDAFTHTVDDGHGGTDTATVTVTITAVNDRPNAVNDGVPTPIRIWLHAGAQSVKVLRNDTSLPDGPETLKITRVTQGHHGVVAITGSGSGLTYRPSGSTTGIDLFTYTISDGHGGTDTATVQVSVARDGTLPKAAITGLTKKSIPGSTRLRLTLTWTLTDTRSGLRSQLLQRRTGSGLWVTVRLASVSTRTAAFAMYRGHLYTFRVRGVDRAGNVGLFAVRSIRI